MPYHHTNASRDWCRIARDIERLRRFKLPRDLSCSIRGLVFIEPCVPTFGPAIRLRIGDEFPARWNRCIIRKYF